MKNFYFVRAITTVAVFVFTALGVFAQPAGANISNAINIGTLSAGVAFSDTKNNSTANSYGNDMGQPSDDIYYKFSLSSSAEVSISHCSSAFDTYMHLLDINGNIMVSNDDNGPLCPTLQSSIKMQLNAGTYYVVSEGYYTNSGDINTVISLPSGNGGMLTDSLTYTQHIDGYLENLNKAYIPTGILYERAYPWASLFSFNGSSSSDTSNYEHFLRAYEELRIASYSPQQIPHPDSIPSLLKQAYQLNNYPIGVLLYDFNTIDTMAVQNNQFYVSNQKLYDVNGRSSSPYIANTAAVISILGKFGHPGTNTFTLPSNYYFSNKGLSINSLSVDFDNGGGYITLQPGGSAAVNYSSAGDKNIKYILSLSNGQTLYANSTYPITGIPTISGTAVCTAIDSTEVTGRPFNISQYKPSGGNEVSTIKAYKYYSAANCSTKQITKPIIFLDGFDPMNQRDHKDIYKDFINQEPLFLGDKLRNEGYDIIILDYKDGGDFMEKNGMAVVAMLEKLYQDHSSTMTSDFVVIGPSMGAPIARYALAWAEKNGINLHSRLYIAFDGALQGASIPIGLQQLISFAYKTKLGKKLESSSPLNCNAAKQLLVHHYSSNLEVPTPHRYFDIFQQNLKNIGYPANTRNVAIINGSKSADQTTTSASQEVMAVRVDARWPLGDIMRVKMFAGSAIGRNRSLNLYIWNPVGKMIGAPPEETGYSEPYTSGYSYDVIPGGYSDTYKQIYDAAVGGLSEFYASNLDPWGGKQPRVKIGEIFGIDVMQNIPIAKKRFYFSKTTDLHSFVPTTSGVDFISSTTQRVLFYNWANEDIVCNGKTLFNAVYAPVANQAHVEITAENAVWFENEIKGPPYPGTGNNYSISGPDTFCGSQLYSINNLPSGATVSWSVSPSGIASASPSGNSVTLTRISDGSVTLTASVTSTCGNMSISKAITVVLQTLSVSSYVDRTPQENNYQYLNATAEQLPSTVSGDYSWYEEVNGIRGAWLATGLQLSNYPIPPCATVYYQCVATTTCGEAVYRGYAYNTTCGSAAVSSSLLVYPNPANTELNINNTDEAGIKDGASKNESNPEFQVRLYNEKGNILRSAKNQKGSKGVKLDITEVPNGTYYLHISKGKEVIKKQVIIQH